jgi:carboxymethylenebutenolidase
VIPFRRLVVAAGLLLGSVALPGCATTQVSAQAASERTVAIATADGSADAVLFTPAGKGPWPAVIVWSDIAGLRPAFADIGRRLSAAGYVVLVPNEFYRSARLDGQSGSGTLAQEEMTRRMAQWRGAISDAAAGEDSKAYVAFLDSQTATDKSRGIGTVGYNVGAVHAFRAAAALPTRIHAVVAIHPLGIATERPNSPHLFVGQSKAAYLVAMAQPDDAREPGDKDDLAKAFSGAGLKGTVEVVPANHGFAVGDNANFQAAGAARVWSEMLALFGANL